MSEPAVYSTVRHLETELNKEEIRAFGITPLLPVGIFSIGSFAYSMYVTNSQEIMGSLAISVGLALVGVFACYAFSLLFALPLYLLLRKYNSVTKLISYTTACTLGAVIIMISWALFGADEFSELAPAGIVGAFLGLTAGVAFWRLLNNV